MSFHQEMAISTRKDRVEVRELRFKATSKNEVGVYAPVKECPEWDSNPHAPKGSAF